MKSIRGAILAVGLGVSCPAYAAIQQLAQAGDPNLHLFQLFQSRELQTSGPQQFVGWIGCTFPAGSADAHTFCNGPHGAQFGNVVGLTGIGCQAWRLTSASAAPGATPGTCQSASGTWNYSGQCSPFVAFNIPLVECAEPKYYCADTTFFGAKLTASCCPGSSNPGSGKCF